METINKLAGKMGVTKQEYVKWYFKQQGCELLEEYQHTMQRMKFKCSCGAEGSVSWNKFTQRGDRCGFCASNGRKRPYSLQEVKQIFKDAGCECLADAYKNKGSLMKYRCECGNISQIRLSDFRLGYRCKECGVAKQSGEKHWAWVKDREQHRQNQLFRKKCYKALSSTLKATGQKKVGRTSDTIGYGPRELQVYIVNHPLWEQVKDKKWHLDHVFPIQAFLDHGIDDMKIINGLDNLQPLPQSENISKSDRYDVNAFKAWLTTKGIAI